MITVKINDREVQLEKPVTVLEAAKRAGVKIPTLCYLDGLEKFGGCRMCLVEIEKMPRMATACTVMVNDGMVVKTDTDKIKDARRSVLEFLLINHPLDCPYCDKAGECELQDLVAEYGPTASILEEEKRHHAENMSDPIIIRNMERCVMCTRCIRMCDDVQGAKAITVVNRGGHSFVEPFSGDKFNCDYCGNCVTVCPVGALMSGLHRYSYRSWFVQRTVPTICDSCGVGCTVNFQMREEQIMRAIPRLGQGVNEGLLCARGRFGYDSIEAESRITKPLIRKDGVLVESTMDEALDLVASRFAEILKSHHGSALVGITSGSISNEDAYVFQRFFRETLKSNNIDSMARLFYEPAVRMIDGLLGAGATANPMAGIENADVILVIGGDPFTATPVLGLRVKAAFNKGAKVVVLGPSSKSEYITTRLMAKSGAESALYGAILKALVDAKGLSGKNGFLEGKIREIAAIEGLPERAGITPEAISGVASVLKEAKSASVLIGSDTAAFAGAAGLFISAAISYVLDAKINILAERANVQGVIDMGCRPDFIPGGLPLDASPAYSPELAHPPTDRGLALFDMIEAMKHGAIKGAYILGENPVYTLPGADSVKEALKKVEFLVVQDSHMTETAELADVVIPAAAWSEKEGSYTNLERRIQKLKMAKRPLSGMDDWMVITTVSHKMGGAMWFNRVEEVWHEIMNHSDGLFSHLRFQDLERSSAWPYGSVQDRHVAYTDWTSFGDYFFEPYGSPQEMDVPYTVNISSVNGGAAPCRIYPERSLFHSHTPNRFSKALNSIDPASRIVMSPGVADRFGVSSAKSVRISVNGSSLSLACTVEAGLDDSTIRIMNSLGKDCAMSLVEYKIDSQTGAALWKLPEIRMERAL